MKTVIILLCAVLIGFGYLLSDHAQLQQRASQLADENRTLQTERDAALAQLGKNQETIHQLTQQNTAQTETIRQLKQTIADQKKQITDLQARVGLLQTGTSIRKLLSSVLVPGIFLPIIPTVLATTYLAVRAHNPVARKRPKTSNPGGTWVRLTDPEIERLIRLRRRQYR